MSDSQSTSGVSCASTPNLDTIRRLLGACAVCWAACTSGLATAYAGPAVIWTDPMSRPLCYPPSCLSTLSLFPCRCCRAGAPAVWWCGRVGPRSATPSRILSGTCCLMASPTPPGAGSSSRYKQPCLYRWGRDPVVWVQLECTN